MNSHRLIRASLIAALVSCTFFQGSGFPTAADPKTLVGAWGGEHVVLQASSDGATLEFDCAHGEIKQPIVPDENGNFDVAGTYSAEHPGPVLRDEEQSAASARYSGHVEGDTMTLKVIREKEDLGTFTLTRNAQPVLRKCR
jgi:hypothetical protein